MISCRDLNDQWNVEYDKLNLTANIFHQSQIHFLCASFVKQFNNFITWSIHTGPLQRSKMPFCDSKPRSTNVPVWHDSGPVWGRIYRLWVDGRRASLCWRSLDHHFGTRGAGGLGCFSKTSMPLGGKFRSNSHFPFEHQYAWLTNTHIQWGHCFCHFGNSGTIAFSYRLHFYVKVSSYTILNKLY